MKIGIIHLSDIHLGAENEKWIFSHVDNITNAAKSILSECAKIYIVVSGDIAYSGKKEEYDKATLLFRKILTNLASCYQAKIMLENRIISVPGNHDCNFDKEDSIRRALLKGNNFVEGLDSNMKKSFISIQKEYRDFVKETDSKKEIDDSLYWTYEDDVEGKKIAFNCYNTAWMSRKKEQKGSLYFPSREINTKPDSDLVVSVFHHSYDWLNPDISLNKEDFKTLIRQSSHIALFGHEHETTAANIRDFHANSNVVEFEGDALWSGKYGDKVKSAFQCYIVDFDEMSGIMYKYIWDGELYLTKEEENFKLEREIKNDIFKYKNDFISRLDTTSIPMYSELKNEIKLSDIFVYPDLGKFDEEANVDSVYIDSSSILYNNNYNLILLEGDNQIGKTSLLNMYYKHLLNNGDYPLMLDGNDIRNTNIDRILRTVFSKQINSDDGKEYEIFDQEDKKKKVILIDNIDKSQISKEERKKIVDNLCLRFRLVILTSNRLNFSSMSLLGGDDIGSCAFLIKSLGYVKRNQLVENFYKQYLDKSKMDYYEELLNKSKTGFEQVQTFLGKDFLPSYPIYILSILVQSGKIQGSSHDETAYGHCYEALITCGLGVYTENDKIDKYYNFLTNLAYALYKKNKKLLNSDELDSFYNDYINHYVSLPLNEMVSTLIKANIIRCEDNYSYSFSYRYIYYFLVAKYISYKINEDVKEWHEVKKLCDNLNIEENANILIFLAHHIHDKKIVDETTLALMSPFDDIKPVTLFTDDDYYSLIQNLCLEIKNVLIENKKANPIENRHKLLEEKDKITNNEMEENFDDDDEPEEIQSLDKALRAIEIVGQILKNRQGSIEISDLKIIIAELFKTTFRTISFGGNFFKGMRKYLIEIASKKIDSDTNLEVRQHKIERFIEITSLNFCLFLFSKVIASADNKSLLPLFKKVSEEIGTPASDILYFSLFTGVSKIDKHELQSIVKKYKNNPVALSIIKARVRSYLYNNFVDVSDRQKIISILNLDSKDSRINGNRINKYKTDHKKF